MIHFVRVPEPQAFRDQAAVPGMRWLTEHPEGRPPPLWRDFREHLADGFRNLCAYSAMYEPVGTVDHWVSIHEDRSRAYDWTNYRFASSWMNACKSGAMSSELLDPFVVRDGWFEILLPSLQLVVTQAVPEESRGRAEHVLNRLRLRDDERLLRQRREWHRMYQDGELSLEGLAGKAPLIATAVRASQ